MWAVQIGRYSSEGALIDTREVGAEMVIDPPLVCEAGDFVAYIHEGRFVAAPVRAMTLTRARNV